MASKLQYPLSELKNLLGIPDKYADWRNFKRKVIDLAIAEINQHTNLQIAFKVLKKNGKIFSLEFEIRDKKEEKPKATIQATTLSLAALSFAQLKAFHLLTDYQITQELALEMIHRVKGSEIIGFEDWYFEAVIRIFESKTNQTTRKAKTGTLVNWFLKQKIFEQGDHFAVIMERLQQRKKHLQNQKGTAWDNRILAKNITADAFRDLLRQNK